MEEIHVVDQSIYIEDRCSMFSIVFCWFLLFSIWLLIEFQRNSCVKQRKIITVILSKKTGQSRCREKIEGCGAKLAMKTQCRIVPDQTLPPKTRANPKAFGLSMMWAALPNHFKNWSFHIISHRFTSFLPGKHRFCREITKFGPANRERLGVRLTSSIANRLPEEAQPGVVTQVLP